MFRIARLTHPAPLTLAVLAAVMIPASAHAQRRPSTGGTVTTPTRSGVTVRRSKPWEGLAVSTTIDATFKGKPYNRTVEAQCEFDDRATPGSARWQWNVLFPPFGVATLDPTAPIRTFSLSIWNPASSAKPAPFSFSMDAGGELTLIQTYGRAEGTGAVRVTRNGAGAKFYVAGTDRRGRKSTATIECSQVRKPEATGG